MNRGDWGEGKGAFETADFPGSANLLSNLEYMMNSYQAALFCVYGDM
jgi:hypothetical protein